MKLSGPLQIVAELCNPQNWCNHLAKHTQLRRLELKQLFDSVIILFEVAIRELCTAISSPGCRRVQLRVYDSLRWP